MTTSTRGRPAGHDETMMPGVAQPEPITAIKLRHPGRVTIAVIFVIMLVLFVIDASNREAFGWKYVSRYIYDRRISAAALVTLELTVLSMAIAIALGLLLAIMRLSPNPVVKSVAWLYLWIFRGTPVYVQLVFWGLIALIYPSIEVGRGLVEHPLVLVNSIALSTFVIAIIGLSLNEAAYMAEIVRAGLLSVDRGQEEAATALGMGWGLMMMRIVVPQSMRIIIPPTGNEVISMLKTTSLVAAIPLSADLYGVARDISAGTFTPIPLLIVASIWYLLFTSILMLGQFFLEKRFSRGVGAMRTVKNDPPTRTGDVSVVTGPVATDVGGKV